MALQLEFVLIRDELGQASNFERVFGDRGFTVVLVGLRLGFHLSLVNSALFAELLPLLLKSFQFHS